jgi:Zn-dependent M28 family amino/carboxypeptidase
MSHRSGFLLVLVSLCGLILGQPGLAQPSSPGEADVEQGMAAIRGQAIRAHMRFLSDDLLEGRATATRGYDIAAKYVAANFEALGLEPAGTGGTYFQSVPMVRMTTDEPECSLALLREGQRTELQFGRDFATSYAGTASSVTAPVVFAGYGVTAPELGYDDYAGIDVKGKIVALLIGAPPTFPHDQRAYYSDPRLRLRNAAAHGAAGALGIATPMFDRMFPWERMVENIRLPLMTWVDAAGRPSYAPPLGAALSRKAAEGLFAGTPHSLADVFQAAEAGRPPSFELPVQASLSIAGRNESMASPNVLAVLPGSDPRLKDEYVVLSAHLDHLGVSTPVAGDTIYNGAYDNASGIAILLEVAQALSRLPVAPRRSVLFLATTGEEERDNSSEFFAHYPTRPIDHIVANVNLDMVLMLYPLRDVIAFGAEHGTLDGTVKEAAHRLGIAVSPDPFPEQAMLIRSDNFSFIQQGVPAISLTVGFQKDGSASGGQALWGAWMHERYHQPGDDMSQAMDFGAGEQFAKLNFLITYLLAQDDKPPSWNPGDFFGDKFRRR